MFDLLSWLFPKTCVGCKRPGTYLCQNCRGRIRSYPSPLCPGCGKPTLRLGTHPGCQHLTYLDGLVAVGRHEGVLQALIKQIKYRGHFDMVATATELMLESLPQELRSGLIIASVPLHPARLRQRGFNQSELLAKDLSRRLHLPYRLLLKKIRATPSQAQLPREKRLSNLRDTFRSLPAGNLKVLLVDDVTTTRTTLNECARVLKQAGAKAVFGLVLVHGK